MRAQPPENFLDLMEPQTNVVDVYYGGVKVGTTLATFTPSYVQIHDALALMPALADVTEPETVLGALTGPLAPHADLVCLPGENEECGVLMPELAGVIFDRNRFRLDIFVNAELRAVAAPDMARHLEPTDTGPGIVSGIRGIVSGGSDEDQSYLLRNDTIVAWMDNRVETSLLYDDDDGLFIDRGIVAMDRDDWRFSTGVFRTAGLDSAAQEKILGVGFESQLDTRVDLDLAYATPLILFLPNRSRVDILRDGRLLSSRVYEAGNQILDTSSLPNGSYDITLEISEIGGESREETRFFSKNPELPPADSPFYIAQIGALVDDSQTQNNRPTVGTIESTPILRLGTLHRLGENWGAFGDLMASNEQALIEIGGVLRERPARMRASLIGTTDRDAGFAVRYSDRSDELGYTISMRQIWAGETGQSASPDVFDPFTSSITELGGGVNWALLESGITMGFQGNYNRRGSDPTWSFGPTFGMLVYQSGFYDIRFNASATQSNEDFLTLGQFTMSYRDDQWSLASTAGFRLETGGDTGPEGSVLASRVQTWEDGRQFQFGAGVFRTVTSTTFSGNAAYTDPLGTVSVSYDRDLDDGDTSYAGEIELDLVGNMNGFSVTGFGGSDAAIVVALDGEIPDEAVFDIYIDGSKRARLEGESSSPILLEPYRAYDISILSTADSLFDYELEAQRITLFPGSVATVTWHVLRILPVFGRVVDASGKPVALARIEGAHDIATSDADGWFQAQVNGTPELTFVAAGQPPCRVPIRDLPHDAVFYDLGTVTCSP